MASTDGEVAAGDRDDTPTPRFRRAKPPDAIDLAVETFLGGMRVDMQTLAAQLDVSPATLYRWFGSRRALLDRVFERLAEQFSAAARSGAQGDGDERVCDYARRLMTAAAAFEPARSFVSREPQLALRLLLGRDGAIHRVVAQEMEEVISQARPPRQPRPPEEQIPVIVQVATALVWATFAIGEEPQIDSAVEIIGMILAAGRRS